MVKYIYKKLFLLVAIPIFHGCYLNHVPNDKDNHPKSTFEVIEQSYTNGNTRVIVRDKETNVIYIDCYYSICPLLNSDGTPKLYVK